MQDVRRWWWVPVLGALMCGGITALLTANWVAGRVEDGAAAALAAAGLDAGVEYVGVDGLNGIGRNGVNVVLEGPAADEVAAVEVVTARSEIDEVVYRVVDGDAAGRATGADEAEPAEEANDDSAADAVDGEEAAAGRLEQADEVTVRAIEQTLNDLFELEPIEFDTARATIQDNSIPTLAAAAELIDANPDAGRLLVVGHTDSEGTTRANQALSEARAAAVVDYLVTTGGVDPERLEAEGRGESELLVDPETTPEDRQRNRRIEWEILS